MARWCSKCSMYAATCDCVKPVGEQAQPIQAHSKTEFERMKAMGANVIPPAVGEQAREPECAWQQAPCPSCGKALLHATHCREAEPDEALIQERKMLEELEARKREGE